MLTIAVVIALAAAIAAAITINRDPNESTRLERALLEARSESEGFIDKTIGAAAAPLLRTKAVREAAGSTVWRNLREKVVGSGMFGGSLEVFLSYQLAAAGIGATGLVTLVTSGIGGWLAICGAGAALVGGAYPTLKMQERLRARATAASEELPEFVELLSMCLTAMSVRQAISFTTQFTSGGVTNASKWLLDTLESRTMDEQEAFRQAGVRVGTPEAVAFFTALGRGHTEGAKVLEIINRQAESLRVQSFNGRRAALKKLPTRMILIFGIHFLPLLFVVASVPLLLGFSDF
jgi:Flp pilus assembly protein TadB